MASGATAQAYAEEQGHIFRGGAGAPLEDGIVQRLDDAAVHRLGLQDEQRGSWTAEDRVVWPSGEGPSAEANGQHLCPLAGCRRLPESTMEVCDCSASVPEMTSPLMFRLYACTLKYSFLTI